MNRKITDLARGLKCGDLAASALTRWAAPAGGSSRDARAIEPKPCAARTRTSRRVTAGRKCRLLGDIDKLVSVQHGQAHVNQVPTVGEKLLRQVLLRHRRCPAE